MGQRPWGQTGQALVETAIVMPLYVFLMLGLLQLGLMHQARLMVKYAAYKAVRAGSLSDADKTVMERAALGVLLPLISKNDSGTEDIKPVTGPLSMGEKWAWPSVQANKSAGIKIATVTICGPLKGDEPGGKKEVDFDDPKYANAGTWRKSEATKLRVQVTFMYRMPIPFANAVIERIMWAQQLPSVLYLKKNPGEVTRYGADYTAYNRAANQDHVYAIPIRANYTMRMMSNVFPDRLPESNKCVIPFSKK